MISFNQYELFEMVKGGGSVVADYGDGKEIPSKP